MFAAREYLRYELTRIQQVLKELLRYRYSSFEFFEECTRRLDSLKRTVDEADENDQGNFDDIAWTIEGLSSLITDIERSHSEEFAWPFAQALKRALKDATTTLFFFRAEGGMSSYAVQPDFEEKNFLNKIASVVFPRALKDSVLLHAVLGHELGHAVFLEHLSECSAMMYDLIGDSPLADPDSLFEWCKRHINVTERYNDEYLIKQQASWAEEFFCDLFGIITMGPAYVHAWIALLEVRSYYQRDDFVPTHPPFRSRLAALLHAARALGMLYTEDPLIVGFGSLSKHFDQSFVAHALPQITSPYALLDQSHVERIALELRAFVETFDGLAFPRPDSEVIRQLIEAIRNNVPPAGSFPAATLIDSKYESVAKSRVDFRHILFAGWIVALDEIGNPKLFQNINSLCSFAIMQQEGIFYWDAHPAPVEIAAS